MLAHSRRLAATLAAAAVAVLAVPGQCDVERSLQRGCDALAMGDLQHAKEYFEQAAAESPTDPVAHLGLGTVYVHAGSDYADLAASEFAAAGSIPEALVGSAYVQLGLGQYALADKLLADAMSVVGRDARSLAALRLYAAICAQDAGRSRDLEAEARASGADPVLVGALVSERFAWLGELDRASQAAQQPMADIRSQFDTDTGAIRLSAPRVTHSGSAAIPRWNPARPQTITSPVFASPGNNTTVAGSAVLHVVVPVGVGGARPYVTMAVDGKLVGATDSPPYRVTWDTTRVPPGRHALQATVRSGPTGPAAAEATISITVLDGPAPNSDTPTAANCRRLLRTFLTKPRLDTTWVQGLESLAAGSAAVQPSSEPSGFRDLRQMPSLDNPNVRNPGPLPSGKRVALFFDDGPNATMTPEILDILRAKQVKASFFLVGRQCELMPYLVCRISADGHVIGSHSYSHRDLEKLLPAEVDQEVNSSVVLIQHILAAGGATDARVRYFRCPGGNVNTIIRQIIGKAGLEALDDGIYNTWGEMELPPEDIVANAVRSPHDIILLHNGDDKTVFVLPLLIDALRAQGYEFITADQLPQAR